MRQTLIVSDRGQLTLPASLRKRFGIKDGGAVILEERDNELVLKCRGLLGTFERDLQFTERPVTCMGCLAVR